MRSKFRLTLVHFFALTLLSVLIGREAAADDGPTAVIHELLQQKQDVKVVLALSNYNGPVPNMPVMVEREGGGSTATIIEDHVFTVSDVVETEHWCGHYDPESVQSCQDDPDQCKDCDGDGILECEIQYYDTYCGNTYHVEILDECVPTGKTTYTVVKGEAYEQLYSQTIEVVDSGESCSDVNCSVASVGTLPSTGLYVPFLAGFVILVSALRKRKG